MVSSSLPATGHSKKLMAKSKGPFKIIPVLPNDRYKVEDLRQLKKGRGHRSVVAVDSLQKWVIFDALD